jgi:hypothetical protein
MEQKLAGKPDPARDAGEFSQFSLLSQGDSKGWKFNREELHAARTETQRPDPPPH